jgi:hypothetical protein
VPQYLCNGSELLDGHETAPVFKPSVILILLVAPLSASAADPCASMPTPHLFVAAADHRLFLCRAKKAEASFAVRLARSGVGKTREGDDKLPIGTYDLGAPRRSDRYGLFIPIGYPTAGERRRGYTGGSVGVHGPDRRVRWLGHLVNTFDTTNGCVGVATDQEMEQVASWIRRTHAATIVRLKEPGPSQ